MSLPSFPHFNVKSGLAAAVMTEGLVGLVNSFESFRDVGVDAEEGMGVFSEDISMGLHLLADFGLVLPIAHIDSLGELVKLGEGWWLPDMGDLILDAIGKAIVEVVPKGTFSVSPDL